MSSKKSVWTKGDSLLLDNALATNNYRIFDYFSTLVLNRFKWTNLPQSLEGRFIEKALYNNGQAFFYKDEKLGYVCLPCEDCSELNIYGEPLAVKVFGHGFSKIVPISDGVRILDNDRATPPIVHINYYVNVLNEITHTIMMNLRQQRFPFIIPTTKETELTVKNIFNKMDELEPVIFTDKTLSEDIHGKEGIKVLNTGVPYLLDKLQDFKNDITNELYTLLGINNANTDKKERMLVDEVNVNNVSIMTSLDLAFKTRKDAVKEINKKFGLNISVDTTLNDIDLDFKGNTQDAKEVSFVDE